MRIIPPYRGKIHYNYRNELDWKTHCGLEDSYRIRCTNTEEEVTCLRCRNSLDDYAGSFLKSLTAPLLCITNGIANIFEGQDFFRRKNIPDILGLNGIALILQVKIICILHPTDPDWTICNEHIFGTRDYCEEFLLEGLDRSSCGFVNYDENKGKVTCPNCREILSILSKAESGFLNEEEPALLFRFWLTLSNPKCKKSYI